MTQEYKNELINGIMNWEDDALYEKARFLLDSGSFDEQSTGDAQDDWDILWDWAEQLED